MLNRLIFNIIPFLAAALIAPISAHAAIKDIVTSAPYRFSVMSSLQQKTTPEETANLATRFCRASGYDRSVSYQIGTVRSSVYDFFYMKPEGNELPEPQPLPPPILKLSRQINGNANGFRATNGTNREVFTSLVCEGSELIAALKQWSTTHDALKWVENFNGRNQGKFTNLNQLINSFAGTLIYNGNKARNQNGYTTPSTIPHLDTVTPRTEIISSESSSAKSN